MRQNNQIIKKSKILEIIIKKIEKDFSNDISILVCYGSFIRGNMHKYSDIDFFFIPKNRRGYKLSFQFIIDEIGYDLWPISWKRAENICCIKEPLQPLFKEGKILYFSTNKDLERYKILVSKLETNLQKKKVRSNPKVLVGFYEEIKSIYNKIKYACEIKNLDLATYGAEIIDKEITLIKTFDNKLKFPCLYKSVVSKDFDKVLEDCKNHEQVLLGFLKKMKVKLHIFNTIEEFREVIDNRV